MIKGYDLIDYYEDTKLYSTGDDYLDDLLERAFCEGYEYAQNEYSKMEDDDYYDSIEKERKEDNQAVMWLPSTMLGMSGGLAGGALGHKIGGTKGAIVGALSGAAAGTGGGLIIGKKLKKKNNEKYDKKSERYKKASKKDKEYLRHKREVEEQERNRNRRMAGLACALA